MLTSESAAEINAAATVTALYYSNLFDLKDTYFLCTLRRPGGPAIRIRLSRGAAELVNGVYPAGQHCARGIPWRALWDRSLRGE